MLSPGVAEATVPLLSAASVGAPLSPLPPLPPPMPPIPEEASGDDETTFGTGSDGSQRDREGAVSPRASSRPGVCNLLISDSLPLSALQLYQSTVTVELHGVEGSGDQLVFLESEDGGSGCAGGAVPKRGEGRRRRRKVGRVERIYDEVADQEQQGKLARQEAVRAFQQQQPRQQPRQQSSGAASGHFSKGEASQGCLQSELLGAYAKMRDRKQKRDSAGDEVEMTSFGGSE